VFICTYLYSCIATYIYSTASEYLYTHTWIYKHICTFIYLYVYKHRCVYEHIYVGTYTHLCKYTCLNTHDENIANLKDSLTEWLFVLRSSSYAMVNHIYTHTHTLTTISYMFESGLVKRNEYMWHFDCTKESGKVLFFLINTHKPSSCLERASQCIVLEYKLFKHLLQNWPRVQNTVNSKFPSILPFWNFKNSNQNSNELHY